MKTGTKLKHKKHNYIVVFKCMVNAIDFRTIDDFFFRLSEFTPIND